METTSAVNMKINSNPKRFWSQAILLSSLCLLSSVFFIEIKSPNVDPVKMQMARYLTPVVFIITAYLWYQYFQAKKCRLIINRNIITWGQEGKATEINWSTIRTITVVNLAEISRQSGWCYEFTTAGFKPGLDGPPELSGGDYFISHQDLMAILQQKAAHFGFTIKT
jgi:hypothetical protein